MFNLSDTQKKWALTATMIAVLGCTVSFNNHVGGIATADFASTATDPNAPLQHEQTKIRAKDGSIVDIKLIRLEPGKTRAVVSTEGGYCTNCTETYVVNKDLTPRTAAEITRAVQKKRSSDKNRTAPVKSKIAKSADYRKLEELIFESCDDSADLECIVNTFLAEIETPQEFETKSGHEVTRAFKAEAVQQIFEDLIQEDLKSSLASLDDDSADEKLVINLIKEIPMQYAQTKVSSQALLMDSIEMLANIAPQSAEMMMTKRTSIYNYYLNSAHPIEAEGTRLLMNKAISGGRVVIASKLAEFQTQSYGLMSQQNHLGLGNRADGVLPAPGYNQPGMNPGGGVVLAPGSRGQNGVVPAPGYNNGSSNQILAAPRAAGTRNSAPTQIVTEDEEESEPEAIVVTPESTNAPLNRAAEMHFGTSGEASREVLESASRRMKRGSL